MMQVARHLSAAILQNNLFIGSLLELFMLRAALRCRAADFDRKEV